MASSSAVCHTDSGLEVQVCMRVLRILMFEFLRSRLFKLKAEICFSRSTPPETKGRERERDVNKKGHLLAMS